VKILYGIGNRIGATIQASRISDHLEDHDIRFIGGNISFDYMKYVHWNVDAVCSNSTYDIEQYEYLIDDIAIWNPDLIISDTEQISAKIANILNIPLWYCSPLHLDDGLDWPKGSKIISKIIYKYRKDLLTLPAPNRIYIYSPFCSLNLSSKCGYEWIKPYYNKSKELKEYNVAIVPNKNRFKQLKRIFNKINKEILCCSPNYKTNYNNDILECNGNVFLTGETSYIADCMYNNKYMYMMPDNKDFEGILNSIMIQNYGLGTNLNQIELLEDLAPKNISKILDENKKTISNIYLDSTKYLHEVIEEYKESLDNES